ncbi:MAG: hypothetical protein HY695_21230 [Deltaproteobacteria bacterium]|nr:hypothetical protein [Deltaproteobacteria bacterium]
MPLSVELVGLLPEVYKVCTKCQPLDYLGFAGVDYVSEQLAAYPEQIQIEQKGLLDLYHRLGEDFAGSVIPVPVGLMSFRGMWLSIRYGLKNAPAVIIEKKRVIQGQLIYDRIKLAIEEELEKRDGGVFRNF